MIAKNYFILALALGGMTVSSQATLLFSDNFNSYTAGNLVGQGTWAQTGSASTPLMQTSGGSVQFNASGQDVYSPLASVYTIANGTSFYMAADITLSAAQATGDYFLHNNPTTGSSSIFVERIFAKASGSGFVLGYAGTSGSPITYGTTVLDFNTDYRIVIDYTAVAGTLNDTASIYVDPTDYTVEANNNTYLSGVVWGSATAESDAVGGINLRQGSASAGATISDLDNLYAGTTFADVANPVIVPEPTTFALIGLGATSLIAFRRRK